MYSRKLLDLKQFILKNLPQSNQIITWKPIHIKLKEMFQSMKSII